MGGRKSDFAWEFISSVKNNSPRKHMIDTQILSHTMLLMEAFDAKILGRNQK